MRLLFVGDVVGRSGRTIFLDQLPILRSKWRLDFVIVNGENAAGGFGITESICEEFLDAGADASHARQSRFDQREAVIISSGQPPASSGRPISARHAGRGANLIEAAQWRQSAGRQHDGPHLHGCA